MCRRSQHECHAKWCHEAAIQIENQRKVVEIPGHVETEHNDAEQQYPDLQEMMLIGFNGVGSAHNGSADNWSSFRQRVLTAFICSGVSVNSLDNWVV